MWNYPDNASHDNRKHRNQRRIVASPERIAGGTEEPNLVGGRMRALKTLILLVTALAVTTAMAPQASSQTPPPAQQPPPPPAEQLVPTPIIVKQNTLRVEESLQASGRLPIIPAVEAVFVTDFHAARSDYYQPVSSWYKDKHWWKRNAPIVGGAGGGALVGGLLGGGKGAVIGGAVGGGGGYLYKRSRRHHEYYYRHH
jgi:hypothetical protein